MQKTILLTGATDGIGLETAKKLATQGHKLLLHGRSPQKLETAEHAISSVAGAGPTEAYVADLSKIADVVAFADRVREGHDHLDVLVNNAGVFKLPNPITDDGLDARFVVNTIAPFLLTRNLLTVMNHQGRVVNVSSAAQAPVNLDALAGRRRLDDMEAYSESKLAITMWSNAFARARTDGPIIFSVNPGSLLASKMVRDGFGVAGNDLSVGADILSRAALSEEFANANGRYFDNDSGQFAPPHPDARDPQKCQDVVRALEKVLADFT